jgi:hypothetical protein
MRPAHGGIRATDRRVEDRLHLLESVHSSSSIRSTGVKRQCSQVVSEGARLPFVAWSAVGWSMCEGFREMARGDSDFDPIRDEPAFQELIGR